MSSNVVVATLNVSFGTDSSATDQNDVLKLELDDRSDGLNNGDTSFTVGDDVYYFLFKGDTIEVLDHQTTAGGKTAVGNGTKTVDDNISFSNSDTSSLNYPPDGAITMHWLGRCYELKDDNLIPNTSLPEVNGSNLKMAGGKKVIGMLNCQYNSTGELYKLSGVPADFAEVMILAIGRASE